MAKQLIEANKKKLQEDVERMEKEKAESIEKIKLQIVADNEA